MEILVEILREFPQTNEFNQEESVYILDDWTVDMMARSQQLSWVFEMTLYITHQKEKKARSLNCFPPDFLRKRKIHFYFV